MQFTCMVIIRCVVLLWISSYEVGDECVAAWHHNDAQWDNTSKCMYISLFCKAFCYPWHGEHQEVQAQTLSRQTFKIFHTGSCHIYKHVNINCVSK